MGYIGNKPTAVPLTSADIEDGVISAADLGANSVDSSELVDGSIDTSHIGALQVTGAKLNTDVISAQTALGAAPADTDELLVSDAGVLKRVDYSYLKTTRASFQASRNSNMSIPDSYAHTKYAFDDEDWDTCSGYDKDTNYRFTVPSGYDGKWFFYTHTHARSDENYANVNLGWYVNGSHVITSTLINDYYNTYESTFARDLSATDYVEVYMWHDFSAGSINMGDSSYNTAYFGGFLVDA